MELGLQYKEYMNKSNKDLLPVFPAHPPHCFKCYLSFFILHPPVVTIKRWEQVVKKHLMSVKYFLYGQLKTGMWPRQMFVCSDCENNTTYNRLKYQNQQCIIVSDIFYFTIPSVAVDLKLFCSHRSLLSWGTLVQLLRCWQWTVDQQQFMSSQGHMGFTSFSFLHLYLVKTSFKHQYNINVGWNKNHPPMLLPKD